MQKLIFTNSKSETLIVEYSKPYELQNLVGLSDTSIDLIATKGYMQDGQSPAGQLLQSRTISFSVIVHGNDLKEVFEKRRNLIRYFNPKDNFEVIYQNDFMSVKFSCRIDSPPAFPSVQNRQICAISLLCDNPYLFDADESNRELAVSSPMLHFPLIFANDIEFSSLANKRITIYNNGDVDTPVRIEFLGGTTNPIITNERTGEYIKVLKEIAENEVLEVTTGYANKKVNIIATDGARTNAFQYIDLSSDFWQLVPGENVISYDAESGADSSVVKIYYSSRYVGV